MDLNSKERNELKDSDRTDLLNQTSKEVEILERYMPTMMSEEDINKVLDEVFAEVNPATQSDIGKIMGKVSPLLKGKADMSLVNKLVKDRF